MASYSTLLALLAVVSDVLSGHKDRGKDEDKDEKMGPDYIVNTSWLALNYNLLCVLSPFGHFHPV